MPSMVERALFTMIQSVNARNYPEQDRDSWIDDTFLGQITRDPGELVILIMEEIGLKLLFILKVRTIKALLKPDTVLSPKKRIRAELKRQLTTSDLRELAQSIADCWFVFLGALKEKELKDLLTEEMQKEGYPVRRWGESISLQWNILSSDVMAYMVAKPHQKWRIMNVIWVRHLPQISYIFFANFYSGH